MKVKLNSDKKIVSEIKNKLKENGGFCPCSLENNDDTKCICKAFREQVERGEAGECHCGLWVAVEESQKGTDSRHETEKENKEKSPREQRDCVGRIAKIKSEAMYTLGGSAIQSWMRDMRLYVSRVQPNGVYILSSDDSGTEIVSLLPKDVTVTSLTREFRDSKVAPPNIDIRIMGVPSRIDNIKWNQKRLHIPDENIFIDENHEGCIKTAKRAWSKPTDKKFVLVLQDDVELCDYFASVCEKIVKVHPNEIISLFSAQLLSKNVLSRTRDMLSPYVLLGDDGVAGCAVIMRTEWIEQCLSEWTDELRGDDTNINAWAKKHGIKTITTVPSTVQHIGDRSVFDPGRVIGRSELYSKSAAKADWGNAYVTSITNIVR